MLFSDSKPNETIVFFSADALPWTDSIHAHLLNSGFQINTVSSLESAQSILKETSLDAVLAVESPDSLTFFETIRNQSGDNSPLLILITEDMLSMVDSQIAGLADLVLPPSPVYIERQLHVFLDLHAENSTLLKQNKTFKQQLDEQSTKHIQEQADLKKEIERLKEAFKKQKQTSTEVEILKNAIVRNVSHELKTPLLQVKSAIALIGEDVTDSKLIHYATNATARLETLVRNITMLGSSLDINLGPVIVRDAIEYARRNLGRVWQLKNEAERIQIEIESNLPPVMADKQGLSTVIQLLMDNALKFSDKTIIVQAKQIGKQIEIQVTDTGIGIAKDEMDTIFESFYQIDSSSTRRYGGTGVGLALVKLILDHHNVQISVKSEIDKGSTFSFKLDTVEINSDS